MRLRSGKNLSGFAQPRGARPYVDYTAPNEAFPIHVGIDKTPITVYDGTGSILDFFDQFELLSNAKEWVNADKCRWFPVYLSGAPAMFYKGLPVATKNDWHLLVAAMKAEFNNAEAKNLFLIKLGKVRQNFGESTPQFAARVQRMAASAYEGVAAAQLGPLLLTHFQQGLRPNIKRHVLMAAPQTFEEAVKKAKTIELNQGIFDAENEIASAMSTMELSNQNPSNHRFKGWTPTIAPRSFRPSPQNESYNRGRTFNSFRGRSFVAPRSSTMVPATPRFGNFNRVGRGYPGRAQLGAGAPRMPAPNAALKRHIQCYNCGRFGHYRDECNKRIGQDPRIPSGRVNFVATDHKALWNEYNAYINQRPQEAITDIPSSSGGTDAVHGEFGDLACMVRDNVSREKFGKTTVGLEGAYTVHFYPRRMDTTLEVEASSHGISWKEIQCTADQHVSGPSSVIEPDADSSVSGDSREQSEVPKANSFWKCSGCSDYGVCMSRLLHYVLMLLSMVSCGLLHKCRDALCPIKKRTYLVAVLFMLLTLAVGQSTAGFEAYDCSQAKLSEDYALTDTKECENSAPVLVEKKRVRYFLYEKRETINIPVKECEMTAKRYIYYCGMWSHNSYIDMDMYPRPVKLSEADCRGYFLDRMIRRYGTTADLTINATTLLKVAKVGTLESDGACSGGAFSEGTTKYNNVVVLMEYSITLMEYDAVFDGTSGRMLTKSLSQCTLKEPTCYTGRSRINFRLPSSVCVLKYLGKLSVTQLQGKQPKSRIMSSNRTVVAGSWTVRTDWEKLATVLYSSQRGVLLFRKRKIIICSAQVFETNYDQLVLAKRRIDMIDHQQPAANIIQARLDLYFNNKLDYLHWTYQRDIKAVYYHLVHQLCTLNQHMYRTKMAIAYKNPQMAGLLLMNEPGVFGIPAGEVMYFYRCEVVWVKLAPTGKCASELSVMYRNTTYYMQPFTRILKKHSTEAICSVTTTPKFNVLKGVWVDALTQTVTMSPKKFDPRIKKISLDLHDIERLHKKGLYTTEQLEATQRAVRSSWLRDDAVYKIVAQGTRSFADDSWQLSNIIKMETPYSSMRKYFGKTWEILTRIGQIMSGLIGAYFVFSTIRVILGYVVNLYNVYRVVGLTSRFCLSLCPLLREDPPTRPSRASEPREETRDPWLSSYRPCVTEELPLPMANLIHECSSPIRRGQTEIVTTEPTYTSLWPYPVVHAVHTSYRPLIADARFNGVQMEMILDTGATVSMISASCIPKGMKFTEVYPVDMQPPKSVTGHDLEIVDKVLAYVLIGKILVKHKFLRTRNLFVGIILGMDFLMQLDKCTFDTKHGLVWLEKDSEIYSMKLFSSEQSARSDIYFLRVPDDLYLMPFEQVRLYPPAYACPPESEFCVEELNVIDPPVAVPPQLATLKSGFFCYNDSPQMRKLPAGTLLAVGYPVISEEIVCAIDMDDELLGKQCLERDQKSKYADVLKSYDDIISKNEYDVGQTAVVQHTIPLLDQKPVKQRPYRCPERLKGELSTQLNSMLEHRMIDHSSSPWASPVLLVKKKSGKFRMCVDYRKLNAQTRKDSYPLPRICDLIEKFKGSKVFSTLDLMKGYYQVGMQPEDKEKTAFVTEEGLYEFNVMPFGLTGAPNTFQRLMDFLLRNLSCAMVYLDDIIIFSPNEEQHVQDLKAVFSVLTTAGLKINLGKCAIGKTEIQFLGHVISAQGISPDPSLTQKVRDCPIPKNVKQVQSFLGLASYYRRFVPQFAKIVQPLTKLVRKDQKFIWQQEQDEAFHLLKHKLVTSPILSYPDLTKPFLLQTDASNEAVGAVLAQKDDEGREHPVAFLSRSLTNTERNYSTTEKECLALLYACQTFRHYLYGSEVTVITDHAPLQWLQNNKDTSSRLIRWSLKIQDLNMKIEYKPGKSHSNADAMSRWIAFVTLSGEVIKAQKDDVELAQLAKDVKFPYIVRENGLFYQGKETELLVVPKQFRSLILFEAHDGLLGAHLGIKRTEGKIMQKYYWPHIREDIRRYCNSCEVCQAIKNPVKPGRQPMRPIVVNGVFERIAMDVLGPLPLSHHGNKYVLVIQEYLTKWPLAIPLPSQEAPLIAQTLVEEVFLVYGIPKILLTDRGSNFTSTLLKSINELWGVKQSFTTPYHPQTDGMVERFNRTLTTMLKGYV